MKHGSYCYNACNYMHQSKQNDDILKNNSPQENTCRDPYYESSNGVANKIILPNELETTMENKRGFIGKLFFF